MEDQLYHTVYLSYEEGVNSRKYVGKHSTNDPYDDYLGSYHDSSFNPVGKFILGFYATAQGATQGEITWQKVLNVVKDPEYVNRAYQTSKGFDTTGRKRPASETSPGGKVTGNLPFWNNGITQTRAKSCPGPEWVKGKLPFSDEHKRKIQQTMNTLLWWVNPDGETTRSLESPGPEWKRGRTWKGQHGRTL